MQTTILEKFGSKIKTLSTRNLFCPKIAPSCPAFPPPNSLTHDAAARDQSGELYWAMCHKQEGAAAEGPPAMGPSLQLSTC